MTILRIRLKVSNFCIHIPLQMFELILVRANVKSRPYYSSYFPDFDGSPRADRPQPNKHAGVVEKLVCSAYLNICVDFGDGMV